MLDKLFKKKNKSDEIVDAYRDIVPELLCVLAATEAPVEELKKVIKKCLSDAEKAAFDNAVDLDNEEEFLA
jgi:hypothetical protein